MASYTSVHSSYSGSTTIQSLVVAAREAPIHIEQYGRTFWCYHQVTRIEYCAILVLSISRPWSFNQGCVALHLRSYTKALTVVEVA